LVAKTPDQARASAAPLPVSAPTVAGSTGATGSQSDYTQFLSVVAKSPALITGYSKLLKAAGYYKGKITDKYTPALQNAFTRAEEDRLSISAVRPIGRDEFLQETVSLGGDGTGGPTTVTNVTKYKPEAARQLVDSIIKDTLGRKATAAEIKKYSAMLKGIEGKAASTTTYGKGANQTQTTMAGLNEQQYLVDQISGTDEGKANQVLGFYETFMNALGGGR
jgi:hypothetical protein